MKKINNIAYIMTLHAVTVLLEYTCQKYNAQLVLTLTSKEL